MSDKNWAENCGELANRKIMPTAFGGHCFYVRKCVTGDQVGDNFWDRMLDGIVLPQNYWVKSRDPKLEKWWQNQKAHH